MAQSAKLSKRAQRNRSSLRRKGGARSVRLSIFRSAQHIYAQIIDDLTGNTVASASSREASFKGKYGGNVKAAQEVGKLIAERTLKAKAGPLKFDRGGYIYHGRVKALADSAREAGLEF